MIVSVDRFVRPTDAVSSAPQMREQLLNRFGLFGIRLASVLLRTGVNDSTALAHELARRSGLGELLRLVDGQFQARATDLKERTALAGVEALVRERPRAGSERLAGSIERIQANAHQFRELRLLATARTEGLGLPAELQAEAERLIGGNGVSESLRLGLSDSASSDEVRQVAGERLQYWRALAASPMTDRATAEICSVVIRSCEAALAASAGTSGQRVMARLVLHAEPAPGSRKDTDDGRDQGEHELGPEQ